MAERPHPLFPILPHRLEERAPAALADTARRGHVERATRLKDATRQRVLTEAFGADAAALRAWAGALRQHTLEHLDLYLDRFIAAARAAGAVVHAARDGAEARALCVAIAREAGARRCVKTKSMVTEEIRLLDALEAAGVATVETDLGEYILQLDGDAPSHIVTPMIHKDRRAVGRAFERELGVAYTEDPAELTDIARRELRQAFEGADLAVTGANFLVADDGAVVICTNEGNGRISTTWPRVRVVVAGVEKLVPDQRALAPLLELLARSSTGQPLTVYTSIARGPRRQGEADGPEALHIILLDNGRVDALADPTAREALRCVRCGACLNACPVYRTVGGHAYGSVYPGPIGAVLTPLLRGAEAYPDLPTASSLCGACHHACPVAIDLPRLLVAGRERLVPTASTSWRARLGHRLWAWTLRWPLAYRLTSGLLRWALRRRAGRRDFVTRLPGPGRGWTAARDLQAPQRESFRGWWRRHHRRRRRKR